MFVFGAAIVLGITTGSCARFCVRWQQGFSARVAMKKNYAK